MLPKTMLRMPMLVLALFTSMTLLPACDSDKSKDTTEEDDDKDEKKKKKKKKGKKKKDDDDKGGDDGSKAKGDSPLAGRSKTLAWDDADFTNDKPANDTFETGSKQCNILLNACMACRDRVKAKEGDMKLWSMTVSECFNLKKTVLAVDAGARDGKCTKALDDMKKGKDCVAASYSAKDAFK